MSWWATTAPPSSSSRSSPRPASIYICTAATSPKISRRIFSLAISPQQPPPRTHTNPPKHTVPGKSLHTTSNSNAKHHSQSHDDSTGQKMPLSGSDVLWALRRATAHKSKKKNKDVSFTSAAPNIGLDNPAAEYTNVLPLSIKTEWNTRLKQLEQRLQQLTDA